jgi:hypothetical protein
LTFFLKNRKTGPGKRWKGHAWYRLPFAFQASQPTANFFLKSRPSKTYSYVANVLYPHCVSSQRAPNHHSPAMFSHNGHSGSQSFTTSSDFFLPSCFPYSLEILDS